MTSATVQPQTIKEIQRWQRLGVAVLPGPRGKKGPRESGWTTLAHEECWRLAREAAAQGRPNLVIRTGATSDGHRHLAAIDLDGKCPCGHNRSDHAENVAGCLHVPRDGEERCGCQQYRGVAPDEALERLLAVLPAEVPIARSARGYHLIFWAARPLRNGVLPQLSADVFGGLVPHALQAVPSLHPDGVTYSWVREPGDDLPTVDLEALGYEPDAAPDRRSARGPRGRGSRLAPASGAYQEEFAELMGGLGLRRTAGDEEFHPCPWHVESEASLHVDWQAAVFYCFGCDEQGGLRRLRAVARGR